MNVARTISVSIAKASFRPQIAGNAVKNKFALLRLRISAFSTISDAIIQDHRELEKCYKEIVDHPDDIDHITRYGNQFTWELARHSVAEELLIYPAFEKYMGKDGHEKAERDRNEHHQVRLALFGFTPY